MKITQGSAEMNYPLKILSIVPLTKYLVIDPNTC